MKNSFDRILTSTPVDKQAAVVSGGKGERWEPKVKITRAHWDVPPKCKKRPSYLNDRSGEIFGRFTVISYYDSKSDGSAQWLVRCACGAYETRTRRAIENPGNKNDACSKCRAMGFIRARYDGKRREEHHTCSDDPLPTKPFDPTGTIAEDLTAKRVGTLTVVGCSVMKGSRGSKWVVRCDCGSYEIRNGQYLRRALGEQVDKCGAICSRCEAKLKAETA